GMPGEDRRCVGCHESRTGQGVPRFGQNPTVAEQRTAEDFNRAIAERAEYPWLEKGQPLLDAKGASCHNQSTSPTFTMTSTDAQGRQKTYVIPTLDLSSREVTAFYDRKERTYAASYVSLFYGAAMEMGGNVTTVPPNFQPPKWLIPASARTSELFPKINLR